MTDGTVRVESLKKEFGSLTAVDDLSFEIKEGEFFTFLGPSGCGKTTTLRMLAGFESPTDGRIKIGDEDVTAVPPYDRDVGMVFQSYALFPHKTVAENVAFGLKMEGVDKAERRSRASEALEMVDLGGYENRSPTELSGGQQQRVALARAIVIEPDVLLLDEPLANLDLKLRQQMRFELKRIQDELGITTVYVTHDQQEALSMSDRILVMDEGQGKQQDQPVDLYNEPANEFVADFIGEANILEGTITATERSEVHVDLDSVSSDPILVRESAPMTDLVEGDEVLVNVRPEDMRITGPDSSEKSALTGTVMETTFYGQITTILVDIGEHDVRVDVFGRATQSEYESGDKVAIDWDSKDCVLLRRTS
ncbi:ABC transporter ATP-binding protein [Halorussus salinisoli]|uniref:ABC transporter ATP-binding protein n=1 Tax=Halorussus salinisoli TaxID=2558242 RepID=UPI0010C19736|nr:ABC transporter ATP-binding protein [Halorussus salinisoli]